MAITSQYTHVANHHIVNYILRMLRWKKIKKKKDMNCVSQSWCMPCQEVAKAIHINKSRPSENNGLKTLTDTLKKTDRWQIHIGKHVAHHMSIGNSN